MAMRLLFISVSVGVLATLLAARIDDALALVGWGRTPPLEVAADPGSILVRRRGISSVEITLSQSGTQVVASPAAVLERASRQVWSSDPLAGLGATAWTDPVRHQVLFRQGWPLDAFSAYFTPGGEFTGGAARGSARIRAHVGVFAGLDRARRQHAAVCFGVLDGCFRCPQSATNAAKAGGVV